jgi:transposase
MKNILKQVVGIDVAQKELVAYLGILNEDLKISMIAHKTFGNQSKGFMDLLEWVDRLKNNSRSICFLMEATGVYHESLAYFLDAQSLEVSIVLPNKISNYLKTLEVKTVTDKTAAEAICRFGLERQLVLWKRPEKGFKTMKQLTRERDQIVAEKTMAKNQLHAEQAEAEPHKKTIGRTQHRIDFLNAQENEIREELLELIQTDKGVMELVTLLCTIPGVGLLTAITVLAETNKFELVRNKRQLASYAGLDVKEKESGTSIKGQPKISKRGNKYLRKAMHLPALTAIRHDERFKAVFDRLVAKHGVKMKAVVAVQRKLLEMIFTIYRTNSPYNKEYLKIKSNQ